MHVGWAAKFAPRPDGSRPSFEQIRAHIAGRLGRAPRYRQRLADVPLGLGDPVWVDDPQFDIIDHVLRADHRDFQRLADEVLSMPLEQGRPLWELWIAEQLDDGRVGVVGKAHHCLVDGLAAIELMALLLDAEPDPEPDPGDERQWSPEGALGTLALAADAVRQQAEQALEVARLPLGYTRSPSRLLELPGDAWRASRALLNTAAPLAPPSRLNAPMSPRRHLACESRSLQDIKMIKQRFGTTVNDVLLAASAGALRGWLEQDRGEPAVDLKTMVPVSVRDPHGDAGALGNRISFVFADLPCSEPDPVERLRRVHAEMAARRQAGEPEGASAVLEAAELVPRPVQRGLAQLVGGGPRAFNLVVSNIPGPPVPLWMRGCRLETAHPVVPLAERHALSIGMTTVEERACFGLYADRETLADADRVAGHLDAAIDELLARAETRGGASRTSAAPAPGRST